MKNYIMRLKAWKASHEAALRAEECIVDLRKLDIAEGKDVSAALAASETRVANRKTYIAEIQAQISEAQTKLSV